MIDSDLSALIRKQEKLTMSSKVKADALNPQIENLKQELAQKKKIGDEFEKNFFSEVDEYLSELHRGLASGIVCFAKVEVDTAKQKLSHLKH